MDLLIATGNAGKLREYHALLNGLPLRLLNLRDVGLAGMEVEESGTTLVANATLKSQAYARASGLVTLADDTGLFVDALGGAPGVYPARYGGPGLTMPQRRRRLLAELGDTPHEGRTARFACVIALTQPGAATITVEGFCEGHIARAEVEGGSGFGYDALFIARGYDVPWSRVPLDEKNRISHRGAAAREIRPALLKLREVTR